MLADLFLLVCRPTTYCTDCIWWLDSTLPPMTVQTEHIL